MKKSEISLSKCNWLISEFTDNSSLSAVLLKSASTDE